MIILLLLLLVLTAYQHSPIVAAQLVQYGYAKCPEVPTLHCKNGSSCTPGIASFVHLDLQTNDSGYHCKCKSGFTGHDCEMQVDECGGNSGTVSSCYNGSKCQKNGTCNCDQVNQNSLSTDTKYAGAMCEHESTSFCASSLVGNHAPNHQFCTNHGVCKRMVTDGEPHPGCDCAVGWMGDHCEIQQDPYARPVPVMSGSNDNGGNSTMAIVLFSLMIVAIVGIIAGGAFIVIKKKRSAANDDGSDAVFQGSMPGEREKTVVSEGDLDMDGSSTLAKANGEEADDNTESNGNDAEVQGHESEIV